MTTVYGQALLTCDAVAQDPSGKLTLYGLFDRIWSSKFPAVHAIFSIYWRCIVPGPGRVGVTILRPDGTALAELEPAESGEDRPHLMQGTYTLGGFEFPTEGEYTLLLQYNGNAVLRTPLSLHKRVDR